MNKLFLVLALAPLGLIVVLYFTALVCIAAPFAFAGLVFGYCQTIAHLATAKAAIKHCAQKKRKNNVQ